MYSLGFDVGAIATKAVLLKDSEVVAYDSTPNEGRLSEAIEQSVLNVFEGFGVSLDDVGCRGGMGWGELYIPFPHITESMISCLARGAHWAVPAARTVVDIGGLSSTVINIDESGRVLEYRTNDRCASGTGFFLELAAKALELGVEELGPMSLCAGCTAHIGTQCAVFGESEIVSHINEGEDVSSIVNGIVASIGQSVATMVKRLGVEKEVVVTGGVAKNEGVIKALEESLGLSVAEIGIDPQVLGAVGASQGALEKYKKEDGGR
jgi:predicted CoA-substrate-specific enzyme activase